MKDRFKLLRIMALALLLAFTFTACEEWFNFSEENPEPYVPPEPPEPPEPPRYENFDPANYVIENETSWTDEECVEMKSFIWYVFAEGEYSGEYRGKWAANFVKTNKIKIILSDFDGGGWAWIYPDRLDRIYLKAKTLRDWLETTIEKQYDDSYVVLPRTGLRDIYYNFITHETMHLDQYRGDSFSLMAGMRPDICAAAHMLTEFLAWFYTEHRHYSSDVYADTPNAIALQSRYMILSCDPWEYDNERIKDPSLPPIILSTPWFNNELSGYAQHAFTSGMPERYAFTSPLRQASREDILRLARSLLNCRDPQMAGVNDEALWTVFEALRKAAIGDSKYMFITDYFHPWTVYQPDFDRFQNLIAQWDANYAAQQY